jgi:hypothetical protein
MKKVFIKPVKYQHEFEGTLYDFELSDEKSDGFEELVELKIALIRNFSVGYSDAKHASLQRQFRLIDIYTIKEGKISVKHTGTKNTLGAYGRGYFEDKVCLNGYVCANGWGMYNKSVADLINKIKNHKN